jgi:hypothetical protein
VAIAIGVDGSQAKLDVGVGRNVVESINYIGCIRIEFAEITIEDVDGVVNLFLVDVLVSVFVDDMKNHGNDIHLIVSPALTFLFLCETLQLTRIPFAGSLSMWVARK